MSHFAVLVITPERPDDASLAATLAPWHEFECTGRDDQYVQNIDRTEEASAVYESDISKMVRGPNGELESAYAERFYREPTAEDKAKVRFVPEGWTEVELPTKDHKTFAQWASEYYGSEIIKPPHIIDTADKHKYDYVLVDDEGYVIKVIKRTNPNKKWDWYSVGGRYTGYLNPSYDPETDPANQERCVICGGSGKRLDVTVENGCNGCSGTGVARKWPTQWAKIDSDTIQKKDVQIEVLRTDSERKALAHYDKCHAVTAGQSLPDWDGLVKHHGIEDARKLFWEAPAMLALKKAKIILWDAEEVASLRLTREERAKQARDSALAPFAFVKDGTWNERGEMHRFACVANEKDRGSWAQEFNRMFDALPPETWITVVDCHI